MIKEEQTSEVFSVQDYANTRSGLNVNIRESIYLYDYLSCGSFHILFSLKLCTKEGAYSRVWILDKY